jgi:hypothetical protein
MKKSAGSNTCPSTKSYREQVLDAERIAGIADLVAVELECELRRATACLTP